MGYLVLKYIHLLSATILFGTGIGTAFFMLMAYLSRDIHTIKKTCRHVVIADWVFTTPAVIIQPLSGILLMNLLHYSYNSLWFAIIIGLYLFAGMCWLPVVFIQYRFRQLAAQLQDNQPLPAPFHRLMMWWITLGCFAFGALLVVYWLMVTKQGLTTTFF
jgi:uncharacterized membrane protein